MCGWAGDTQHSSRGVADMACGHRGDAPTAPAGALSLTLRLQIPVAFVLLRPVAPEEPLAFSGLVVHLEMSGCFAGSAGLQSRSLWAAGSPAACVSQTAGVQSPQRTEDDMNWKVSITGSKADCFSLTLWFARFRPDKLLESFLSQLIQIMIQ